MRYSSLVLSPDNAGTMPFCVELLLELGICGCAGHRGCGSTTVRRNFLQACHEHLKELVKVKALCMRSQNNSTII